MDTRDWLLLAHPAIAIFIVFPLIGIVIHRATQVRQRRIENLGQKTSKISPTVGQEHSQIGRVLTGAVVGVTLLALFYEIGKKLVETQKITQAPQFVLFLGLLAIATIGSFAALYRARKRLWRALFATATGMGLVILAVQEGVYRDTKNWLNTPHYYYGIAVSLLMIFTLAIQPDIYKDRTNRWRTVHIILNSFAALLFIGQAITGPVSLLEIPLNWQKPYIQKLYEQQCDRQACNVTSAAPAPQAP
jgi:cytochrome c biogenesis factor